jgi:hypothetical protein
MNPISELLFWRRSKMLALMSTVLPRAVALPFRLTAQP